LSQNSASGPINYLIPSLPIKTQSLKLKAVYAKSVLYVNPIRD